MRPSVEAGLSAEADGVSFPVEHLVETQTSLHSNRLAKVLMGRWDGRQVFCKSSLGIQRCDDINLMSWSSQEAMHVLNPCLGLVSTRTFDGAGTLVRSNQVVQSFVSSI